MRPTKILFIAPHRPNRSPSQRYRFEQYIPYLEKEGTVCRLAFLVTEKDDAVFYAPGKFLVKGWLMFGYFLKRVTHVFLAFQFDVVFIQREAFFIGGAFFERLFKWTGKKIIFDFDDAIWLPNVSEGNKKWLWLKSLNKTGDIIKLSDHVVAGNNYLAAYAKNFNSTITVIPSTVDLNFYTIDPNQPKRDYVTIGWSGSPTTVPYFQLLEPVFIKLKKKYGSRLKFTLLGDQSYCNNELEIQGIKWTNENEVAVIQTFDIGIMPMPDDEWSKGKCSMKGIQYMALAIPTIMAKAGMNLEVIQDGVNGFLAASELEWEEKLSCLIEQEELRNRLGNAGKKTIDEKYTTQAQLSQFRLLFKL
jgi:glycosyltransferase involved in cell wall biosynthesis